MSYRRDSATSSTSASSYREAMNELRVPPSSQLMMHPEDEPLSPAAAKSVHFDMPRSHSAGSLSGLSYSAIQEKVMARQKKGTNDLINRLYDTSSNSQALAAVRQREKFMMKRKGEMDLDLAPKDKVAKPPAGRMKPPAMGYKTTILRSDYEEYKRKCAEAARPEKFEKIPPHL
jgi:hypothetical protein